MAVTQKRLYGSDNTPNTLTIGYTVPALTSSIVTCVTIANKSASRAGVTVTIAGVTLVTNTNLLDVGVTVSFDFSQVLNVSETIQVQASAANAIALLISGVEVS